MTTGARFVDSDLGFLLGQASHALYTDFDAHVRAAGLTAIEWRVLATLHDGAALPVSTLAREVLSRQPTVTKLVQRMRMQGWLTLQADPTDQRRTLVAATPAGRDKVLPLLEQARTHEACVRTCLNDAEVKVLKALLGKLALKMKRLAADPATRQAGCLTKSGVNRQIGEEPPRSGQNGLI